MFAVLNEYDSQEFFNAHKELSFVTPEGGYVVESDVTITSGDKVLTLSTCRPGGTERFIVMGKLVAVTDN